MLFSGLSWSWQNWPLWVIPVLLLGSLAVLRRGKSFTAILGLLGLVAGVIVSATRTEPPFGDYSLSFCWLGAILGVCMDLAFGFHRRHHHAILSSRYSRGEKLLLGLCLLLLLLVAALLWAEQSYFWVAAVSIASLVLVAMYWYGTRAEPRDQA
jgi:hypothetical protein